MIRNITLKPFAFERDGEPICVVHAASEEQADKVTLVHPRVKNRWISSDEDLSHLPVKCDIDGVYGILFADGVKKFAANLDTSLLDEEDEFEDEEFEDEDEEMEIDEEFESHFFGLPGDVIFMADCSTLEQAQAKDPRIVCQLPSDEERMAWLDV